MTAFDTDIYSDLVKGIPSIVARMATVPVKEQFLPIVVVEEVVRGRLNAIRKAQVGGSRLSLERAYELFAIALDDMRSLQILHYTTAADAVYRTLVAAKIRIGTRDLRIAAISSVGSIGLATCLSKPARSARVRSSTRA